VVAFLFRGILRRCTARSNPAIHRPAGDTAIVAAYPTLKSGACAGPGSTSNGNMSLVAGGTTIDIAIPVERPDGAALSLRSADRGPASSKGMKFMFSRGRDFGTLPGAVYLPRGRFAMLRTDLDAPLSMAPRAATSPVFHFLRLCSPGILLVSCAVFGAAQSSAQDVAEAARDERVQKESKQKKPKHVYTEQDLKRAPILTPEDRAQVEAKKNRPALPSAEKSQEAVDAQSLPPDASLGDVARRFRKQKQSQKLQQSAEFHLGIADAPALASPKPPVMPLRPPVSKPAAPRFVPYQPPVKRSPFERPRVFFSAPLLVSPSRPPAVPVTPSRPAAPIAPAAPAKSNIVTVKPGDSLWKIARQNLGKGLRWHELLAVNPGIVDAHHIVAGSQIYLPAAGSFRPAATKITVREGDTLSKIAQTRFGHASCWASIAQANPAIRDANRIFEGQLLLLPARCKP
jgi:phage tail protein X